MNEGKYSGRRLRIQKMKTDSAPTYVSDIDFARIYALATEFKPLLAESYTLYRDTGMRLTEGFSATLNGNILVVPSSKSKSHIARKIILTAEQIPVWEAMVKEFVPDYLSRKFHDFCRELGIDRHFHDLRHSYGVRTWLKTKDLFFVKKTMGHSTVSVTEKYCDFDFAELQRDFPELTKELSYFAPKYKVAQ
jgi:integrase